MISNAPLTVILPVRDMNRAVSFYAGQLGMADLGVEAGGNHLMQATMTTTIGLMAAEEGAQSSHTVVSFEVEDITREISELEGKGVIFLDYDLPDLHTVDHVCVLGSEKAAWFADTEGNILCLHQNT